ncbi:hypothetical protein So717_21380 [Roseobacter cerasinus]|uniref:GmrSD restriction endonucleases N-terminal domain-containing protein n=1 Tax=Roseobacter cerasinus TaxID=2602289 RepID=A0A640VU19_9RHOB|nr:DUF262 domain-containing protein [Roseobacter cerasinus]GFE50385.1 hypothetical protein So717_21380 [Roseobacter cerasinus]
MAKFDINTMSESSVLDLVELKPEIQVDPEYQRPGGVWSLYKKQLFIDSLINRYDIPKFYFHYLIGPNAIEGKRYAVIDGRQRLEAIWDFVEGKFALGADFSAQDNPDVAAANMTYSELSDKYPRVLSKLHTRSLPVQVIIADELDFIEDMFTRLNEATPLNAAEKRNAFGGPLPTIFRDIAALPFFTNKVKVSGTRYRYHDLAAKLLYLEHVGEFVDTKKASLDAFVKDSKAGKVSVAQATVGHVIAVLTKMAEVFADSDVLLKSSGMVVVYYLLFSKLLSENASINFGRAELSGFEDIRRDNRAKFAAEEDGVDFKLIEFDELAQSSNDGAAIQRRYEVLREHVT